MFWQKVGAIHMFILLSIIEWFSSVQSLGCVLLFATPWMAARQGHLSITNSQSSLKLMSIKSVMPSRHLILCHPLLLLPPIPPAAVTKSLQSCLTLCDPIDGSPPGSPVPGILQARTLEWVAISFSNAWKWKVKVKSLSCDPMDWSSPCSSVHGIFQARVLEWGAIAFSKYAI